MSFLSDDLGQNEISWLLHQNEVLYASLNPDLSLSSNSVINLVQGVYELFGNSAHYVLRNRIFTTERFTESSYGIIKVAAKRVEFDVDKSNFIELISSRFKIKKVTYSPIEKEIRGQDISVKIFDSQGILLSEAKNQNYVNKTLHAEVLAIQSFVRLQKRKIPRGSLIQVTHKPCKMCAGFIHDFSDNPHSLTVEYLNEVKGRLSRQTILDRIGVLKRKIEPF